MFVLEHLPPFSKYVIAFIDSLFLVLFISPALYFIFLRPLLNQIIIRERIEESLVQLNRQLEERIEDRTARLRNELEERRITEERLVEHQKQLRFLSSQLSIAEEKEKLRIATELHDNIGHALAMMNNRLELLRNSLPSDKEKKFLNEIQELVVNAIRYTRSLGTELSSPLINHLSFVAAVEWLAEDILGTNGIAFSQNIEGSPQLPPSDNRVIFIKAIKEIMINIVKHAKATNVEIIISKENDDIIVKIRDNGMGFDVDAISPVSSEDWSGFGVFTIRERIADLNGHFQIVSEAGLGTDVTLSIPYTNTEVAQEA
jgi:signal transduction histidine kinase